MRMFRSIMVAGALALAACASPGVSQAQLQQARGIAQGLDATYVGALQVATAWARQPRCGSPKAAPAPLCSTAAGVVALEPKRAAARTALDHLDAVLADAASTPDAVSVAVSAARNAIAAYQEISQ